MARRNEPGQGASTPSPRAAMTAPPTAPPRFTIRPAQPADAALVLSFVRKLADYERLTGEVQASEADLRAALFGPRPSAEVVLAEQDGRAVGFALFFHTFSTFVGKPGLWLEDIFVDPEVRGRGCGRALMAHLARLAVERDCGRFEWSVLNWNEPSIAFYRGLGAQAMDAWTGFRLSGEKLERLAARA
jgi:GNAT superfamily N-acetyltransferase